MMSSNKAAESILPPAGRMSVTVVHDSQKSYGLRLMRRHKTAHNGYGFSDGSNSELNDDVTDDVLIHMIANQHSDGMLKGSPLQQGDILKTINNKKATTFLGCQDYIRRENFEDGQAVTFVAEPPSEIKAQDGEVEEKELESGSAIVRAFCRRSISIDAVGVDFHRVIVEVEGGDLDNDEVKNQEGSDEIGGDESSSPFHPKKSSRYSSFLQIDRIDPNGMFAHSVLNQGDIVLAINGHYVCADENTTAEKANELLLGATPSSAEQEYETVDILALNPRALIEFKNQSAKWSLWGSTRPEKLEQMKKQAKRAGVAIGGGAMLGVGAIVHPFGTLLLPVGLSVLGKEFETPNRIVKGARDSFEKWSSSNTVQVQESSNEEEGDSSDCSEGQQPTRVKSIWTSRDDTFDTTPMKPTMSHKMKGVGRRYVLPFLDRMVAQNSKNIDSTSSFDIDEDYNIMAQQPYRPGRQHQYQRRFELQGRDDDVFGVVNFSNQQPRVL